MNGLDSSWPFLWTHFISSTVQQIGENWAKQKSSSFALSASKCGRVINSNWEQLNHGQREFSQVIQCYLFTFFKWTRTESVEYSIHVVKLVAEKLRGQFWEFWLKKLIKCIKNCVPSKWFLALLLSLSQIGGVVAYPVMQTYGSIVSGDNSEVGEVRCWADVVFPASAPSVPSSSQPKKQTQSLLWVHSGRGFWWFGVQ